MPYPSPSEILADMVAQAGPDEVGVWRVSVPTGARELPFGEAVFAARPALQAVRNEHGQTREAVALINLLQSALMRHTSGLCACRGKEVDAICASASDFANAIALPS